MLKSATTTKIEKRTPNIPVPPMLFRVSQILVDFKQVHYRNTAPVDSPGSRCHNSPRKLNVAIFQPGQSVRVNLEGIQVGQVLFHAAVNAAIGNIVRQTSTDPAKYLIKLLFSFRGVSEVEVPEDRISAA